LLAQVTPFSLSLSLSLSRSKQGGGGHSLSSSVVTDPVGSRPPRKGWRCSIGAVIVDEGGGPLPMHPDLWATPSSLAWEVPRPRRSPSQIPPTLGYNFFWNRPYSTAQLPTSLHVDIFYCPAPHVARLHRLVQHYLNFYY
jgi:hypothetical protein